MGCPPVKIIMLFVNFCCFMNCCSKEDDTVPDFNCQWLASAVLTASPYTKSRYIRSRAQSVHLSLNWTSAGINFTDMSAAPAFPYFVKLQLLCYGPNISSAYFRKMLIATDPVVKITYGPYDMKKVHIGIIDHYVTMAAVRSSIRACITDVEVLNSSWPDCMPEWVTPLPVYNQFAVTYLSLQVVPKMVVSPFLQDENANEILILPVNDYGEYGATVLGQSLSLYNLSSTVPRILPTELRYMFGQGTMFTAVIQPSKGHILFTYDQFESYDIVQISYVNYAVQNNSCATGVFLRDTVALPGVIGVILLTKNGVFVVPDLNNASIDETQREPYLLLDACTKRIIFPMQFEPSSFRFFLLIGDEHDSQNIFIVRWPGESFYPGNEGVAFLESSSGDNIHDFLAGEVFSVLDVTISTDSTKILFLLDSEDEYLIVSYAMSAVEIHMEGEWNLLSRLRKTTSILDVMPSADFIDTLNLASGDPTLSSFYNKKNVNLSLSRIFCTSQDVFLTGLHIVHSHTGQSWYTIGNFSIVGNQSNVVTLIKESTHGLVVFLTSNGEVWVMKSGGSKLMKLIPSVTWDKSARYGSIRQQIVRQLRRWQQSRDINLDAMLIYTIFFDVHSKLKILLQLTMPPSPLKLICVEVPMQSMIGWVVASPDTSENIVKIRRMPPSNERCVQATISARIPDAHFLSKRQVYFWHLPRLRDPFANYDSTSLLFFQGLIFHFFTAETKGAAAYASPINYWKANTKSYQDARDFLRIEKSPYYFQPFLIGKVFNKNGSHGFKDMFVSDYPAPPLVYLDKYGRFLLVLVVSLKHRVPGKIELEAPWVSIQLSDPRYLAVDMEKQLDHLTQSAHFNVTIAASGRVVGQTSSGRYFFPSWVIFHVWLPEDGCPGTTSLQASVQVNVKLGCPPQLQLVFDWNRTRYYTRTVANGSYDCSASISPSPCFFYDYGLRPFFAVVDKSMGLETHFDGAYTLLVVGHGKGEDFVLYSPSEILQYNSLLSNGPKIMQPTQNVMKTKEGYPIYDHLVSEIMFLCMSGTPCADIYPDSLRGSPEFEFLFEVSNRGVDNTTNCDFTTRFSVRVHGLPISTLHTVALLFVTIIVLTSAIAFFLLCSSKGWRAAADTFELVRVRVATSMNNVGPDLDVIDYEKKFINVDIRTLYELQNGWVSKKSFRSSKVTKCSMPQHGHTSKSSPPEHRVASYISRCSKGSPVSDKVFLERRGKYDIRLNGVKHSHGDPSPTDHCEDLTGSKQLLHSRSNIPASEHWSSAGKSSSCVTMVPGEKSISKRSSDYSGDSSETVLMSVGSGASQNHETMQNQEAAQVSTDTIENDSYTCFEEAQG